MVKKVIGVMFLVLAAIFLFAAIGSEGAGYFIPAIIFTLIGLVLLLIKGKAKAPKEDKERQTKKHEAEVTASLKLTSGLPLAEDTPCTLFVTPNSLVIEARGQTFAVNIDKMIAAQKKTDMEIEKEVTSSAGKAIAGGLLFGPVGAIVGSRAKTKKHTTYTNYLIINYTNNSNETAVLVFDGGSFPGTCVKLANALTKKINMIRPGMVTGL